VLTKDEIHTLIDVVLVNPTCVDPLPQSYTIQILVAFDVV
jgi:hypothetical protein